MVVVPVAFSERVFLDIAIAIPPFLFLFGVAAAVVVLAIGLVSRFHPNRGVVVITGDVV